MYFTLNIVYCMYLCIFVSDMCIDCLYHVHTCAYGTSVYCMYCVYCILYVLYVLCVLCTVCIVCTVCILVFLYMMCA